MSFVVKFSGAPQKAFNTEGAEKRRGNPPERLG
jgi:hypothetical protein